MRVLVLLFVWMEVGSIVCFVQAVGGGGGGGKNGAIKKTEREMQVSATSRHCERNG